MGIEVAIHTLQTIMYYTWKHEIEFFLLVQTMLITNVASTGRTANDNTEYHHHHHSLVQSGLIVIQSNLTDGKQATKKKKQSPHLDKLVDQNQQHDFQLLFSLYLSKCTKLFRSTIARLSRNKYNSRAEEILSYTI